jgi:hypothetical protein
MLAARRRCVSPKKISNVSRKSSGRSVAGPLASCSGVAVASCGIGVGAERTGGRLMKVQKRAMKAGWKAWTQRSAIR